MVTNLEALLGDTWLLIFSYIARTNQILHGVENVQVGREYKWHRTRQYTYGFVLGALEASQQYSPQSMNQKMAGAAHLL